jgi:hypothetical protein
VLAKILFTSYIRIAFLHSPRRPQKNSRTDKILEIFYRRWAETFLLLMFLLRYRTRLGAHRKMRAWKNDTAGVPR